MDRVICEWKAAEVLLRLSLAEGMADFQEVSYLTASCNLRPGGLHDSDYQTLPQDKVTAGVRSVNVFVVRY